MIVAEFKFMSSEIMGDLPTVSGPTGPDIQFSQKTTTWVQQKNGTFSIKAAIGSGGGDDSWIPPYPPPDPGTGGGTGGGTTNNDNAQGPFPSDYAANTNNNWIAYIIIPGANGEPIGERRFANGTFDYDVYYLKDHLGHIRVKVKCESWRTVIAAQDFYPYGEVLAQSMSISDQENKYLFQGKERDWETGLDYVEARYYDPAIGMFRQVDPLWEKYPGWNPYNYTVNDPINKNDPDGRFVQAIIGAAVGATVEFGAQVAVSMANGQSFSEAVSNVDFVDVGIAAAAGAVSGGLSTVSKLGTAGRALMSAGISVAEGAAKANLGSNKSKYSIGDAVGNAVMGGVTSIGGDAIQESIKANSKKFKVLTKTAKKLGNVARKGRPRRAQTERYHQALKAVQNYGSVEANSVSQAGSGIVNTVKGISGSTTNSNQVILNQGLSQTPSDHTGVVVTFEKEDQN